MSTSANPHIIPAASPLAAIVAESPSDAIKPVRQPAQSPRLMCLFLSLADFTTLAMSVGAAFRLWHMVNPQTRLLNPALLLVPGCCVAEFTYSGHYPGIGLTAVEHMRRLFRGVTLVYLLLTAVIFLTKTSWADSRGTLVLAWILSLTVTPLGRWIASDFLSARSWWGVPVVILGAGKTGSAVIRNLRSNRILGYRPVACLDDDPEKMGMHEGIPVVGSLLHASAVAKLYGAQCAIVAISDMPRDLATSNLRRWRRIFQKIVIVSEMADVSSLWTQPRDLGGLLGLEMRQNLLDKWNQRLKRAMDIVISSLGLLVAVPILAICAAWVKKVSAGKAFYTQEREGKDGRIIRVLKIRTMFSNAENMLEDHLARDAEARQEWNRFCKLKRDPRILPVVGHFLRKSSIDELPQLWNILKGEMSLVGPRPFPAYHNQRFDAEFRSVRTQVTPGLTGLWQVSARSDGDLEVQEALDGYYIRNWSMWLDLYILVRTIRAIFEQKGSY